MDLNLCIPLYDINCIDLCSLEPDLCFIYLYRSLYVLCVLFSTVYLLLELVAHLTSVTRGGKKENEGPV